MTLLEVVTLTLFTMMLIGLWVMIFDWLNRGDKKANRISQCPPHDWAPTYQDGSPGQHTYVGLRCGKCKRYPNELKNSQSWFDNPLP